MSISISHRRRWLGDGFDGCAGVAVPRRCIGEDLSQGEVGLRQLARPRAFFGGSSRSVSYYGAPALAACWRCKRFTAGNWLIPDSYERVEPNPKIRASMVVSITRYCCYYYNTTMAWTFLTALSC